MFELLPYWLELPCLNLLSCLCYRSCATWLNLVDTPHGRFPIISWNFRVCGLGLSGVPDMRCANASDP